MLKTRENLHTLIEITLPKHKMWTIEGDRRGDMISCLSGTLWITQEGDMKDYVLEAGRDFWITKRGEVIVQALEDTQFKFSLNQLKNHIENNTQPLRRTLIPRIIQHLR